MPTRISYNSFTSMANSDTQSITVPENTTFMVCYVTGHKNISGYFASMTIDGAAMTKVAADANTECFLGSAFWKGAPTIGSVDLAWNWSGTSDADFGVRFVYVFYSGTDTTLRDSDGVQAAVAPFTTKTLTALSGDVISVFAFGYAGGAEGSVVTWSNATLVSEFAIYAYADCALAQHAPSGNVAVSASETYMWTDGGILAIVLKSIGTVTQEGYRFRLDDGDQANATWAANQDTGITASANTVRRLRVLLDTSGDANAAQYQLEYKEANDANYTKVT